ncbi:tRNA isopentenyl-2-thiomethyl-A-37 hydroxylase MiaE [Arsenophonus nasoniae]
MNTSSGARIDLSVKRDGEIVRLYDAKILDPIHHFLACEMSQAGIDKASQPENLAIILCDHLLCELKAAQSAMLLLRKYAVDEQSSDTLLQWLQLFENFAYKKITNIDTLKGQIDTVAKIRALIIFPNDLINARQYECF